MLRTTRCLQDLPELLTVNNTEPLTADDVLDRLADLISQKQQAEDGIEEAKTVLSLMRKNGLIGDELSLVGGSTEHRVPLQCHSLPCVWKPECVFLGRQERLGAGVSCPANRVELCHLVNPCAMNLHVGVA